MSQTSYPFDTLNTTEAQYSQLFRRLQYTGVSGTPAGTELKAFGDSSGMNVKVPVGFAIIRGHAYSNASTVTLNITAGNANPRRDLVVLRLDPSVNSIVLAIKAGTPSASPSDPSLVQTDEGIFELPIARVEVPANAVTVSASNVVDLRTFIGAQVGLWTTAGRPASPVLPAMGYNTTIGSFEIWNGTTWRTITLTGDALLASQLSVGEQANLNVGRINGSRISVQQTAPSSPSVGDLWFW